MNQDIYFPLYFVQLDTKLDAASRTGNKVCKKSSARRSEGDALCINCCTLLPEGFNKFKPL